MRRASSLKPVLFKGRTASIKQRYQRLSIEKGLASRYRAENAGEILNFRSKDSTFPVESRMMIQESSTNLVNQYFIANYNIFFILMVHRNGKLFSWEQFARTDMQFLRCAGFLFLIIACLPGAAGMNLPNSHANMDMPSQPRTCNKNAANTRNHQSMPKASGTESLQNDVATPSQRSFFLATLLSAT